MGHIYKINSASFFAFIFFIVSGVASAQQAPKVNAVTLRGMITEYDDEPLYNASIKVYEDTTLFTTAASGHDGRCKFTLPLDHEFVLVFVKEGYVSKRITINTFVPGSVRADYKFAFNMNLFEELKGVDTSILNEPLAKIAFNLPKREFDYNENHTVTINRQIEKLYRDYFDAQAAAQVSKDQQKQVKAGE
jgi:hypothetical protein